MNKKSSYTLNRGFDIIGKIVEKEGYSPFDKASLQHLHTAYLLAERDLDNLDTALKENIGNQDQFSKYMIEMPRYLERMKKLYEIKVLSDFFDDMDVHHIHIPGKGDYILNPVTNNAIAVEGDDTSINHYDSDSNLWSYPKTQLKISTELWENIKSAAKKDDGSKVRDLLEDKVKLEE